MQDKTYEWRVLTFTRPNTTQSPLEQDVRDEQRAREWALLEQDDYPHATVKIQRREVGQWEDMS